MSMLNDKIMSSCPKHDLVHFGVNYISQHPDIACTCSLTIDGILQGLRTERRRLNAEAKVKRDRAFQRRRDIDWDKSEEARLNAAAVLAEAQEEERAADEAKKAEARR